VRPSARSVEFAGGLLVLADNDRVIALDDQAGRIWRAAEAGATPAEIANSLADAYPAEAVRIRGDVEALVSRWSAEGLFAAGAGPTAAPPIRLPPTADPAWTREWSCCFRNFVVRVAVESPQRAALLDRLLGHFPAEGSDAAAFIEVRGSDDCESVVFVDGREYAREPYLRNVQRALIELVWPDAPLCAILHGGAVALGQKVACFPGVSGSGKTTLIARLIGQGLTYLADDLTPVDMRGRIVPWPMPMKVKLNSWGLVAQDHPTLEDSPMFEAKGAPARALKLITDAWQSGPAPPHVLIFPKFGPGKPTQVSPLTPFGALRQVIEAGIMPESPITEERIEALRWIGTVPAYLLSYGDVDEAVLQAVRLLEHA
jgi:Coenzyme PQQ synthesis protein D (PqqD)